METMTTDLAELIARTKERVERSKAQLLRTFEFVPDEKLRYAPASSARTALQIVSHCGMANFAFATILRGEELEMPTDPVEAAAQIRMAGHEIAAREEAVKLVEDSSEQVLAALENVTDEMLETAPHSPFGPMPFTFWMALPADHISVHASQIDYLQTIWGDLESH